MKAYFLVLAFLTVAASQAAPQGGYVTPNSHGEGCAIRSVTAVLEKISPEGHLVLDVKGDFMAAKTTERTRYRIPGYTKKELRKGAAVHLKPKSRARMRICESTGEVLDMRVLELPKERPAKP